MELMQEQYFIEKGGLIVQMYVEQFNLKIGIKLT